MIFELFKLICCDLCFIFSVLYCALLVESFWEAMLISYLATRVTVLPFFSIETLLKDTDYKVALLPGTSYEDLFRYATDSVWQDTFKERIEPYLGQYQAVGENIMEFATNYSDFALWSDEITIR